MYTVTKKNVTKDIWHGAMYGYWIQRYDYSVAAEVDDVSLRQAIQVFEKYPWADEFVDFDEGDADRRCPPGIGYHNGHKLTHPEARILHICAWHDGTFFFNFDRNRPKRFMGLVPYVSRTSHYVETFARSRIPELIRWYFEGRDGDILSLRESDVTPAEDRRA